MSEKGSDSLDANGKAPTLWGVHTYLSMGATIVIFIFLALMVDLERVWQEVLNCNKSLVLLGMAAHYATYPVRGMRWSSSLMHLPSRCGRAKMGLLVFFYNAVDNVVPAKLGDVYGSHLARINCGIRRSAAIGSLVFLRMVDAWVVLLLALLSSWTLFSVHLPKAVFWALAGGGIIAVMVTFIMLVFFLMKRPLPHWLPEKVQEMIRAFQTGMWPQSSEAIRITVLTLIIWALETLWIFLLALGFGMKLNFMQAIFLTMIPVLASAFPFTPSGAGVVEVTLYSCLRIMSNSSPLAVSVTVVNRFIDYWLHIGLGVVVWALRRKLGLRTLRELPAGNSR